MKKFIVVKNWYAFTTPTVIASFDREEDAVAFANLSKIADDKHEFDVYRLTYTTAKEEE